MKALIFAAGLGTRLQPLTNETPKALIPVLGTPLLEIQIQKLIAFDICDIIINTHHLADQVVEFLRIKKNFGINIVVSDESGALLDTGGGIRKAAWFFEEEDDFLVHNVDVLSNINLQSIINFHKKNNTLATLAVRQRKSNRYLLLDPDHVLCGWHNIKTGEKIMARKAAELHSFAFSGIHVINTRIFSLIKETGKFSIIKTYLNLAGEHLIRGFEHSESYWFDVGTLEQLKEAEKFLQNRE